MKAAITIVIALLSMTFYSHTAAGDTGDENGLIIAAIADNGEDSQLNSQRLKSVVRDPQIDPDLYELLGQPVNAEHYFGEQRPQQAMNEDAIDAISSMAHYVVLIYSSTQELTEITERLRTDSRFGYVDVPKAGRYLAAPNDTFFQKPASPVTPQWLENYQWGMQSWSTNLTGAWDYTKGWATLGIMDAGPSVAASTAPGWQHLLYRVNHADLNQIVAYNQSWDYRSFNVASVYPRRQLKNWLATPHGTHVLGIAAANSNNGAGVAGVCWNCSVNYGQTSLWFEPPLIMHNFTYSGAQAANLSGYLEYTVGFGVPCSSYAYGPSSHPACPALKLMNAFDVPFVAASGNYLSNTLNFPSSDPLAIAVGGMDSMANVWDERTRTSDPWDVMSGPWAGCTDYVAAGLGGPPPEECGHNSGAGIDFIAPARKIVSTLPYGAEYSEVHPQHDVCNDASFSGPLDGYGFCTGTSMAAPMVTAMIGLARSANPLLSKPTVVTQMASSASSGGVYSNATGWGTPNAQAVDEAIRGTVGCAPVKVRATPMFLLSNISDRDRLYTTRPQLASGALSGQYLTDPLDSNCWDIGSCSPTTETTPRPYTAGIIGESATVTGYGEFPGYKSWPGYVPQAAFWVLTSDKTAIPTSDGMSIKPLYRMSFVAQCDWRDHFYTTEQSEINLLSTTDYCPATTGKQSFHFDAIEGYIFKTCPEGFYCNNTRDYSDLQALYRRWSATDQKSALILESQLSLPQFATYTTDHFSNNPSSTGFLGYVILNIDSDGDALPDGFERLLGLNWMSTDTDGDGMSDLVEYPLAGIQAAGRDPYGNAGACQ
jgi:serine protease